MYALIVYYYCDSVCHTMCVVSYYDFAVVFQVGTDIIYTLSFVWDFKQAMMTTAIKDGLTEVGGNLYKCMLAGTLLT